MKKYSIFLIPFIFWSITGCETPTGGFERTNRNDPFSPLFTSGTIEGLQVSADTAGVITILWADSDEIATKYVLEKSLGDSLNFTLFAELSPDILQFSDTTMHVSKNTYYRLSSYVGAPGKDDKLIGRSQALLEFGEISNLAYEFLSEEKSLRLSWSTDVPFYTHFIISSENVISEQQDKSVRIPAAGIEHGFIDPLRDIDFVTRNYTVKGIIEDYGIDEAIIEEDISFDTKSFFQPENVSIDILNEQDWEISWGNVPYFATQVEVIRFMHIGEIIYSLPKGTTTMIDSLIVRTPAINFRSNQNRRYEVRFLTENEASREITVQADIDIPAPTITAPEIRQDNPESFTLSWDVIGNYTDLIKEFIIERSNPSMPGSFMEVARVNGNTFEYTLTNVNVSEKYLIRIRTVTSISSTTATFTYANSNVYDLDYSFDTGMNYVTSMEVTSDKKYLAAVSFRSGPDNSILITDIELKQQIAGITVPTHQITDIKISPDSEFIYFAVPTEGAIYRADFPTGSNKVKIINDASLNAAGVFRIDVSRDGTFIVGLGRQGFVKRWNLDTFELIYTYNDPSNRTLYSYKNIAISPDGAFIGGNDGITYILDAQDGTLLTTLPSVSPNMTDIQFSADGNYFSFVVNYSSTHIYRTANWIRVRDITNARRNDFHSEKPNMVIFRDSGVYTYDLITFSFIEKVSNEYGFGPLPVTQNAITMIDSNQIATVSGLGTIQIWKKAERLSWLVAF